MAPRMSLNWCIALVLMLCAGFPVAADETYFVTTGHTGAQVQVDINHTQHWTYTMSGNVRVSGGLFTMKRGPKTFEDITFDIIEGTFEHFGSATPLLSVTLPPSAFTQQFDWVPFPASPFDLSSGVTYTGVLHSSATDPQAAAYFIKASQSVSFVDEEGNPPPPGDSPEPPPGNGEGQVLASVPEPAGILLWSLMGLVGMTAGWRRIRASPKQH